MKRPYQVLILVLIALLFVMACVLFSTTLWPGAGAAQATQQAYDLTATYGAERFRAQLTAIAATPGR